MLYAMLYAVNIRFAISADDRAVDLCVVYMRATYSKYILHKSSKPATYIWVRLIIGCVQYTLKYGSYCSFQSSDDLTGFTEMSSFMHFSWICTYPLLAQFFVFQRIRMHDDSLVHGSSLLRVIILSSTLVQPKAEHLFPFLSQVNPKLVGLCIKIIDKSCFGVYA